MKKFISAVCALLVAASSICFPADHPRLFLTDQDLAVLRSKIVAGEEIPSLMHAEAMALADAAVADTEVLQYKHDVSGRRILSWSRKAIQRITSCAYAYRYTGDSKYLDKAVFDLRTVCAFPDWNAVRHFLDAGEMAFAVGVGYDWLYDSLPEDLRTTIENCLENNVYAPSRLGKEGFYWRTNNWNQVCNAGTVVSAIARFDEDDPELKALVDSCIVSNVPSQEKLYKPDGNYAEGPSYWNYGTTFEVLLLRALEDAFGTDYGLSDVAGFMGTGRYELNTHGAVGKYFNYADNPDGEENSIALWYFAGRLSDPTLLYREAMILRDGNYSKGSTSRFIPVMMGFVARTDCNGIVPPSDHYYSGGGLTPVVMIHGDWSFGDSDTFLGIKGGAASNPHAHMDVGTFVYDAYGHRWSMDYNRANYASVEARMKYLDGSLWDMKPESLRWKLFRYNNRQHSTLTINDSDHFVPGKGTFVEEYRDGNSPGAKLDMTPVFQFQAAKVLRTVRIIDGRYLEIRDEVTAKDTLDADVRWTMITPSEVSVTKKGVILRQDDVRMRLQTKSDGSSKPVYTTWSNDPRTDPDYLFGDCELPVPGVAHVGFTATVPAGQTAIFVTTFHKL